jgi:photosystem II stability/assembly factor-like uncharacterized protein
MKKTVLTSLFAIGSAIGFSQTWQVVPVPTTENLRDIEFPPNTTSVGYIGGENGLLLKTTDGGQNWSEVNHIGIDAPFGFHFSDLEFANDNVGYAALEGTIGLYKTIDGGSTWTVMDDMSIGSFCFRNTLHVIDENHFFASGAGCFQSAMIIEYNNGVWSEKIDEHENYDAFHYVRDMEFRGDLGIATVNDHLFLRSTDAGQTWDTIVSPVFSPSNNLTDVLIVNDTLIYAGHEEYSGQYLLFQSNDAGITWWNAQATEGDLIYYASWFALEQSSNGDIYASASQLGGEDYMHENNDGVWSYEVIDHKILSIDSYGSDVVYAVGDSGYVIVNSGSQLSLTENELKVTVYPNPSLDVLHLNIEDGGPAEIRVTDLTGREVAAYSFEGKIDIQVSDWNSGLYVLHIHTNHHEATIMHVKR